MFEKVKYGMVGGGPGAFIGKVHRKAVVLDSEIELVAGAFSSDPEKSKEQGKELNLNPSRVYASYEEMAEKEASLPEDERIDFVSIVTPNHLHYPIAKTFIEAGINVVCDKPMVTTIEEAESLCKLVKEKDVIFAVTFIYTGYPMVKQAKELIKKGELGEIRKVIVEYPQGWAATAVEKNKDVWRFDTNKVGVSLCMGDLGAHVENITRYTTGLEIEEVFADLNSFIDGRKVDDDGNVLVHFNNGAHGILYASMISVGEENNLRFRIYGTEASLEWHQENPNYLYMRFNGGPDKIYSRAGGMRSYLEEMAKNNCRLPGGHPEGFIEAFANIYLNAKKAMISKKEGRELTDAELDFPNVQDGAKGIYFTHKVVESNKNNKWTTVKYNPP